MTKQEFLDSFTEWMSKMAEEIFPADVETIFTDEQPSRCIIDYNPRNKWVRTSNLASHYRISLSRLREEMDVLGISTSRDDNFREVVHLDEAKEIIRFFSRKYNNFND